MILEDYRWDISNCNRCSQCKWVNPWDVAEEKFSKVCPAFSRYLFDAWTAQGKLDIGMAILLERIDANSSNSKMAEIIYECNLCGACDIMCKRSRDMEVLLPLKALRAKMLENGKAPKALKTVIENVKEKQTSILGETTDKNEWAREMEIADASSQKTDVLLFAGCSYGSTADLAPAIRNMADMLKQAGVSFGILGVQEPCCGRPYTDIGDFKQFDENAMSNLKQFKNAEVKTIIAPCAECYTTIKVDYARVAHKNGIKIEFETVHMTEYMDQLLKAGSLKPKKKVPMKVTFHDPCHLARLNDPFIPWQGTREAYGACTPPKILRRGEHGSYDAPRNLIQAIPGVELVEMQRSKENTWCCGAGGGVKLTSPEFASWTAEERIQEAETHHVDALITACPNCKTALSEAAGDRLPVYDVAELLTMSIGEEKKTVKRKSKQETK